MRNNGIIKQNGIYVIYDIGKFIALELVKPCAHIYNPIMQDKQKLKSMIDYIENYPEMIIVYFESYPDFKSSAISKFRNKWGSKKLEPYIHLSNSDLNYMKEENII